MIKTLSFGAVIWDIMENEEHLGGDSLNVAANLRKLGAESYFLTRIGNDRHGRKAFGEIAKLGIKTEYIQRDRLHRTGYAKISYDVARVPSYIFARDSGDEYITVDETILNSIKIDNFDVFWFSSYCQASEISRTSLTKILKSVRFGLCFFDANIRRDFYRKEMLTECFEFSDIIKMNENEFKLASTELYRSILPEEEFAERIKKDFKPEILCITKGSAGCSVYDKNNIRINNNAIPFPVVDTVGSGDAFSCAFIMEYFKSGDAGRAACAGNILGGFVASQKGAIVAIPDIIYERLTAVNKLSK
jgi:fructokinase